MLQAEKVWKEREKLEKRLANEFEDRMTNI